MNLVEDKIGNIRKLCDTYKVEKLYVFGSAVGSDFNDESDIDLLVKFKPLELSDYFQNYINFKENLKELLGREIDLVEEQTLKNPILIKSINRSKELIYG